jgi:hypothetical protein
MNKNKGFIGIGLILAIVLGIAVVGGGAYYLGKSKGDNKAVNNPADYLPANQDQNLQPVNQNQPVVDNIPITLPVKYLGSQNWPPVITNSTTPYSCKISSGSGPTDLPPPVKEKIINGKKYCIFSFVDAGAGQRYGEYTYTTANGSGTKIASFNLQWSSCAGYGGPGGVEYDKCMSTVSTFFNNLDIMVDSLMQAN